MKIYGASGHAKVIYAIAISTGVEVIAFVDDHSKENSYLGLPITTVSKSDKLIIGIGDNTIRKKVANRYVSQWHEALIHKSAIVSCLNEIGLGSVVMPRAVVNESISIGRHCIVNTAAVVEHDCILNDFSHISPNATLSGGVHIGEGTHVGAGAVIIPNIRIGKWCVIGAGAVIIKDVPDYAVVVGNPGQIIKYRNVD